ncbi:MAG: GNAT family N-acetyltransferase, partial [Dehalococcoidia bacterium]|nr:GNAT family N-acetyltransferase [Dehalococcoidia bacterium]
MNTDQTISIRQELPTTQTASRLIRELDAYLSPMYPEESQHGYSIEKLVEQKVEFFVLYHDERPAGCAGIQFFSDPAEPSGIYGELKRMYVRSEFRGLGLGRRLL